MHLILQKNLENPVFTGQPGWIYIFDIKCPRYFDPKHLKRPTVKASKKTAYNILESNPLVSCLIFWQIPKCFRADIGDRETENDKKEKLRCIKWNVHLLTHWFKLVSTWPLHGIYDFADDQLKFLENSVLPRIWNKR